MVLVEEHLLQIWPTVRGSTSQHSQEEISACPRGEHSPLPLMSKGESDLVWWLPSSPKGEIVGIMIQVLSLMATYSEVGTGAQRLVQVMAT